MGEIDKASLVGRRGGGRETANYALDGEIGIIELGAVGELEHRK